MNVLAESLNQTLNESSPSFFEALSSLGKEMFFPKGIIYQGEQANKSGCRLNATVGIATNHDAPVHLPGFDKYLSTFETKDVYSYAPTAGRPLLRKLWTEHLRQHNPSLSGKSFSNPIVTAGITHGIALVAEMFANPGDRVILPSMLWGNYNLIFKIRHKAEFVTFPFFSEEGGFNHEGFKKTLEEESQKRDKLLVLLNFPNNPSGYVPNLQEANLIIHALKEVAQRGTRIVVICDDAYFGLFYGDSIQESLFGSLIDLDPKIIAVKLDGATKECCAWGFRTGFITFGGGGISREDDFYTAIEQKIKGLIRSSISNCSHLSQTLVEKLLQDKGLTTQQKVVTELLKKRADLTKEFLSAERFHSYLSFYPFNSGYFCCVKLKGIDAEALRLRLLEKYDIGVIALDGENIRIAFSSVDQEDLQALFDGIFQACVSLKSE